MSKNQHTAEDWPRFEWPTPEELRRLAELKGPPIPGRVISLPWYLYPTYMAMYNLVPNGASPLGNIYVKRGEK